MTIARPTKIYDFTAFARRTPNAQLPADRIDAQLQNHADAIAATQRAVEQLIAARATAADLDIKAIAAEIKAYAEAEFGDLRRSADFARALADQAQMQLQRMFAEADRARDVADRSEARVAAAHAAPDVVTPANEPRFSPGQAMPSLGYGAGGFYASDDAGAAAVSADYAQVSIEWAEHLPDTIPPNILAINSISGEHWSSRWWANRAASAFGMLAWWYMGAWPGPPPTTPLTPTGQPIPEGGMYFDTDLGMMLVWNGSSWVPLAQGPAAATTSSLYYLATAGQTVFPLGTADLAGHTFAFNQTTTEGLHAHVNGVRVTPTADYTVNTVSSTVTFARGVSLNAVVAFDLLTSVSLLAPSGSALTVLLSPIAPDGVKTVFTGLTVAATSAPVNVAHNEELLVSVNGVQQQPGAAYNALGAQITFAQAPEADANVFIIWFGPSSGTRVVAPPSSVWSADDAAANGMTLSNGGLTVSSPNANAYSTVRGTLSHSTGKFYVEFQTPSGALVVGERGNAAGADVAFGIANSTFIPTNYLSSSNYSLGSFNASGTNAGSSGFTSNYTTGAIQPSAGDVFSIAIDLTAGKYWLARNNVWYGSGAPATGVSPMVTIAAPSFGLAYFPGLTLNGPPSGVWTLQSTAASQKYAPPGGFKAWDAP